MQLCDGARDIQVRFDIKKRLYIGNTTMDPHLAALMCTLARIRRGSLVVDPFSGTGGILIAAANLGALCFGIEIDYKTAMAEGEKCFLMGYHQSTILTGKTSRVGGAKLRSDEESIRGNFKQYGLEQQLMGIILGDSSRLREMLRPKMRNSFDAIVTDREFVLLQAFSTTSSCSSIWPA